MQPEGGSLPKGGVLHQIEKDFGSFTNFRDEFTLAALSVVGSGWVWLYCESSLYSRLNLV
jgi:superoxide dismutase, Fe-Mn family